MELRINYIIVDEKNRWLSTGFESTIEEIEEDIKEIKQDLKNKGEKIVDMWLYEIVGTGKKI
jgi:hypothetical protein